jgi:serine/threonine protein kinase
MQVRHIDDITDCYEIQEELGRGGFAVVKKGVDKVDKTVWAIKIMTVQIYQKHRENLDDEAKMLMALDFPSIVKLREGEGGGFCTCGFLCLFVYVFTFPTYFPLLLLVFCRFSFCNVRLAFFCSFFFLSFPTSLLI